MIRISSQMPARRPLANRQRFAGEVMRHSPEKLLRTLLPALRQGRYEDAAVTLLEHYEDLNNVEVPDEKRSEVVDSATRQLDELLRGSRTQFDWLTPGPGKIKGIRIERQTGQGKTALRIVYIRENQTFVAVSRWQELRIGSPATIKFPGA